MQVIADIIKRRVIQVFEHQQLGIGSLMNEVVFQQADFEAMCQFAAKYGEKYFKVLHNGVRFKHYVGVIQAGTLTIEILPKADKEAQGDKKRWQDVLLAMLKVCRLLKPEKSSTTALGLGRHMLFDLYIEFFIDEVEHLLRDGLLRQYQRDRLSQNTLKGKLLFQEQIRRHHTHRERFFCEYDVYTFDHPFNQIIGQALKVIKNFILPSKLQSRLNKILNYFIVGSALPPGLITERHWSTIRFNRKTERYKPALDFAYLILLNYSPDIRHGQHPMVALLFDMNLLFQEYVYHKLANVVTEDLQIRRQLRKSFWHKSSLQPDIVLTHKGQRIVVDTKWKVLKNRSPSIEDLRQMYVYSEYFNAERTVLLFPNVGSLTDFPSTPFAPRDANARNISCQLCFVSIIKGEQLNFNLGRDILEKINP